MKKIYTIIALILISLTTSAQTKSGREKGFVFRPELGIGFFDVGTFENICPINTFIAPGVGKKNNTVFLKNDSKSGATYNVLANVGANLSHYVFLGGGAGLYGNSGSMAVAFYGNPRFYTSNKKSSFFIDIKAGYALNIKRGSIDNDKYYIKNDLFDKTNYYFDGNEFHTTEDYKDFITINSNELKVNGFFASIGIGIESNRSSFGIAFDLFNVNLKTTVEEHYWSYSDDGTHGSDEAPTVYHKDTKSYDDSKKFGFSFAFKYGYNIFK